MAFPTTSSVFGAFITDMLNRTTTMDLDLASVTSVALFNNSLPTTPTKNDTSAQTAYNGTIWSTTYEVTDAGGWTAGGKVLTSKTSTFTNGTYTFDAADAASTTLTVGISNAYGVLVYDNATTTPVAKQGICFLYFGGAVSAPSGTLTVVFNPSGIFTIGY